MKFFLVVCVLLAAGSVECGRRKRFAFGPPKAVAAPPAVAAAVPSPLAAKSAGMNAALTPMVDELEKENALGGPVNTAGLQKASILAKKIELMGGDVDPSTKDELDELTADFVEESVDFSAFLKSADKPEDTAVNMPPGAPPAAAAKR